MEEELNNTDNNEGINYVFEPEIPDIAYLQAGDKDFIEQRSILVTGGSLNSCFEK